MKTTAHVLERDEEPDRLPSLEIPEEAIRLAMIFARASENGKFLAFVRQVATVGNQAPNAFSLATARTSYRTRLLHLVCVLLGADGRKLCLCRRFSALIPLCDFKDWPVLTHAEGVDSQGFSSCIDDSVTLRRRHRSGTPLQTNLVRCDDKSPLKDCNVNTVEGP